MSIIRIAGLTAVAVIIALFGARQYAEAQTPTPSMTGTVTNISATGFNFAFTPSNLYDSPGEGEPYYSLWLCYANFDEDSLCSGGTQVATKQTGGPADAGNRLRTSFTFSEFTYKPGFSQLYPSRRYVLRVRVSYFPFVGNTTRVNYFLGNGVYFQIPTVNAPTISVSDITDDDATFTWNPGDYAAFEPFAWVLGLHYAGSAVAVAQWGERSHPSDTLATRQAAFAVRSVTAKGTANGVAWRASTGLQPPGFPTWSGELRAGTHYDVRVYAFTSGYLEEDLSFTDRYAVSAPVTFRTLDNSGSLFREYNLTATAVAELAATATAEVADARATETAVAGDSIATATAAAQATAQAKSTGNPLDVRVISRQGTSARVSWDAWTDPQQVGTMYYALWMRTGHYTFAQDQAEVANGPDRGKTAIRVYGQGNQLRLSARSVDLGSGLCRGGRAFPGSGAVQFSQDRCELPNDAFGPMPPNRAYTLYIEPYWVTSGDTYHHSASGRSFLQLWSGSGGIAPTPTPATALATPTPRSYPTPTPTPQPRASGGEANFVVPLTAGRVVDAANNNIDGVLYGRCDLPACIREENDNRSVSFLSGLPPAPPVVFALDSIMLSAAGTKSRVAQIDLRYTTPTESGFTLDIPPPELFVGNELYSFQGREPIIQTEGRAQSVSFRYDLGHDFPAGASRFYARVFWVFESGLPTYLTVDAVVLRIGCSGCAVAGDQPTPTPLPITAGLDIREGLVPNLGVGQTLRLSAGEDQEYRVPFMQIIADTAESAGISPTLMFGIVVIAVSVCAAGGVMVATRNLMLGAGTLLTLCAVATTSIIGLWSIGLVLLLAIAFFAIILWTQSHQI